MANPDEVLVALGYTLAALALGPNPTMLLSSGDETQIEEEGDEIGTDNLLQQ